MGWDGVIQNVVVVVVMICVAVCVRGGSVGFFVSEELGKDG